jgi:hypothetical protein
MIEVGSINERIVLYQKHDPGMNWYQYLPKSNWLLFCITEIEDTQILDEIARKAIDNNVCYACCVGKFGEKLHDIIDENLVIREVELPPENHLPDFFVMTVWDETLYEGLDFAACTAIHESVKIDKIFCLDVGIEDNLKQLTDVLNNLNRKLSPEA